MYLPDRVVTPDFRRGLLRLVPGLDDNAAYWRFLGHLAFSGWKDWETGELFLPSELLAMMEGRRHDSNYSGWKFIERFMTETGIQIEIRAHDWGEWRRVISVTWPEGVEEALYQERRQTAEDRVLLSSGQKWRREHQTQDRKRLQAEAMEHLQDAGCQDAYHLLTYLNGLAPNRFSALKRHLVDAHALVDTLSDIKDKEHQHNVLQAIRLQAQPIYEPVERSVRIFSINDSILRLHRAVRKVVTQDWITADLRSAQLAIVARVWDVPQVTDFLQDQTRSIWKELAAHLHLDLTEVTKEAIKDGLYMLVFGAGFKSLRAHFEAALGDKGLFDVGFLTHPLIRALLKARTVQLKRIRQTQGAIDAYGRELRLQHVQVPDRFFTYDTSRSILAQVAQSYELKLLSPVIKLAMEAKVEHRGFVICTWLHDGFTFEPFQRRDVSIWKDRLQQAVREEADRLGIHTELEFT